MGKAHLDDIYFRDEINIYGVVDVCEARAREYKNKYNALSFSTDYKEYIKDPNVDIIIIATYPSSHLEILRECIKNGKHVLCEKPIASSLNDGKEFIRLVKNAKSKVLVGYILRHNESYKRVFNLIQNGAIGKPITMRMVQNYHTINREKYVKLIEETSPIIDSGVHYIDVMRWFTNSDIVDVSGICQRLQDDIPKDKYDYGMITARLTDGSTAYYEVGWGSTIAPCDVKEFIGPNGRITLTYRESRVNDKEKGDLIEYYKYPENTYNVINVDCKKKPAWEELKHLIGMIESDIEAIPSIEDVYQSFYIAIKADEKIRHFLEGCDTEENFPENQQ